VSDKASRAKQFLPFAALKGYYDEIRERTRVIEPRRERTEDENNRLSDIMNQLKKGMMVKIKFYRGDAYETLEGLITHIDLTFRTLTLVKTKLDLDDIYEITCDEIRSIQLDEN
jgi:hypothetical protein